MKKLTITLFFISLCLTSYCQWVVEGTKMYTSQNIGIGTGFPEFKLDVLGNMRLTVPSNDSPIYGLDISVKSFKTTANAANSYYMRMRDIGAGENSPDVFIVKGNRNVGIGTSTPTQRLDVNGNIRSNGAFINGILYANEVKVESTVWPDFVFDKDYKLRSLDEVENHINQHKHLPEIPSQKEVAENGVNIGELQAKLLQKIEELTLYVIDLKKENQEQGRKIEDLERKLESKE